MIFRQKKTNTTTPLYFIVWSKDYPTGKDKDSPGGWGVIPDLLSGIHNFKLEIIK